MDDSDWNNDFDENFDEVLRKSVNAAASSKSGAIDNSNGGRFYNRSPVKETAHEVSSSPHHRQQRQNSQRLQDEDDVEKETLKRLQSMNLTRSKSRNTITLEDFNDMKRRSGKEQAVPDYQDQYATISDNNYIDGFDEEDFGQQTIRPGQTFTLKPQRKKSLRFSNIPHQRELLREDEEQEEDGFEDDFDAPENDLSYSPNKRSPLRFNQQNQIRTSPSRSTSSSTSLGNFSETDYTDNEDEFFEGIELDNDINLIKQYQLHKERALHQAQMEYENAMKYNSLLHRKVQSSNNIAKYLQKEDEDFMDGFDPFTGSVFQNSRSSAFQQPRIRSSHSTHHLRGKHSMPVMRQNSDYKPITANKLKHSASNYYLNAHNSNNHNDVYRPALSKQLGDNYTVRTYDGRELDGFDDLEEDITKQDKKSIRKLINLASYIENQKHQRSKKKSRRADPSHNKGKSNNGKGRMGLIKQMSNANSETVYSNKTGDMKYNPKTYRWEGNEMDLSRFDTVNSRAPTTITKKQMGQNYQIVKNMVFDPEKMCWINMDAKNGEEDDDDPFKDLEDLPAENDNKRTTKNNRGVSSSSTVMTSSTIADNHRLADINEEDTSMADDKDDNDSDPFDLPRELIHKFKHEEMKWNKKVKNWFQPGEEYDRDFAYEIRRMVTDNV